MCVVAFQPNQVRHQRDTVLYVGTWSRSSALVVPAILPSTRAQHPPVADLLPIDLPFDSFAGSKASYRIDY